MLRRFLDLVRSRHSLERENDHLRHRLDLANETIDSLREQRETYRETLNSLRWRATAEGAEAKVYIETLKGAK